MRYLTPLQINEFFVEKTRGISSAGFGDPAFKKVDLGFSNAEEAFRSKTNRELLRGYLVFQLCTVNYLVDHNKEVKN